MYRKIRRKPFKTLSSHCYKLCIHSVQGMYRVYAVNFCLFWTCFCPFRYVQGLYFGGLLCVHCVYTLCTVSVGGHLCRNYRKRFTLLSQLATFFPKQLSYLKVVISKSGLYVREPTNINLSRTNQDMKNQS